MRRRVLICIFTFCCIVILLVILANIFIAPAIFVQAEMQIKNIGQGILNDAMRETLLKADYTDLVNVQRNSEGDVQLVTVNAQEINNIENIAATFAQQKLMNFGKTGVSINMGTTFSNLTTGWGPDFKVYVQPKGTVDATYYTKFETGGVNQTRHKIYIHLTAELKTLIGLNVRYVTVTNDILVCETIIVGKVPQSYIDVNNKEDMLNLIPTE